MKQPFEFETPRKFWNVLSPPQRRWMALLLVLMIFSTALEVISLGLIVPVLALLSGDSRFFNVPVIARTLAWLGDPPRHRVVQFMLLALAIAYAVKVLFQLFLVWRQSRFMGALNNELSERLFRIYLHQPWTFHLQRNSAELIRNVGGEVGLFTNAGSAMINILAEFSVFVGITALLFAAQPAGTLVVLATLAACTWLLQRVTKGRLVRWAKTGQEYGLKKSQRLFEGLNGVKDAKVLGREKEFVAAYRQHDALLNSLGSLYALVQTTPRLYYELIAVMAMSGLGLVMIAQHRTGSEMVGVLGLFCVSAFRLLPSANRMMMNVTNFHYASVGVDKVDQELQLEATVQDKPPGVLKRFTDTITLDRISYRYPAAAGDALRDVSLRIPRGAAVGILGQSGAGKSTLVDIILGLLPPSSGRLLVDGVDVQADLRGWQSQIGYVPQAIYLSDDSLRRNVAFGIRDELIDDAAIARALHAAQLTEFVASLPEGANTVVGERGVRLSGGQRQRIGIARALYHDPQVLILDEATSALDTATEEAVIDAIHGLHGEKTLVIVAHRLTTLVDCDVLYRFQAGRLVHSGSFAEVTAAASS